MRYLGIVLLSMLVATAAVADQTAFEDITAPSTYELPMTPPGTNPVDGPPLYDNGPVITGVCPGIGDESAIQAGGGTFGWGHQVLNDNRVADDFTIPAGEQWQIELVNTLAYQTGATSSTITAVNYKVWLGAPPGGLVMHDSGPNAMIFTFMSGIFRTSAPGDCSTNRQLQDQTNAGLPAGMCLPEGTYWLDWQSDGTASSGPWIPPVTPSPADANGMQSLDNGITWAPVIDATGGFAVDFPFKLFGVQCGATPVEETTWGRIKASMR